MIIGEHARHPLPQPFVPQASDADRLDGGIGVLASPVSLFDRSQGSAEAASGGLIRLSEAFGSLREVLDDDFSVALPYNHLTAAKRGRHEVAVTAHSSLHRRTAVYSMAFLPDGSYDGVVFYYGENSGEQVPPVPLSWQLAQRVVKLTTALVEFKASKAPATR